MSLGETARLEIRAEAFNLLNRPQYGDPASDVSVPAQFGIIQSTINTTPIGTGTPRQLQFMCSGHPRRVHCGDSAQMEELWWEGYRSAPAGLKTSAE